MYQKRKDFIGRLGKIAALLIGFIAILFFASGVVEGLIGGVVSLAFALPVGFSKDTFKHLSSSELETLTEEELKKYSEIKEEHTILQAAKLARKEVADEIAVWKAKNDILEAAVEGITKNLQGLNSKTSRKDENLVKFSNELKVFLKPIADGEVKFNQKRVAYNINADEIFKAAIVMTTGTPTLATDYLMPYLESGIKKLSKINLVILKYITVVSKNINGEWNQYSWREQATITNNCNYVLENATNPNTNSSTYITNKKNVVKWQAKSVLTEELMTDANEAYNDARQNMAEDMLRFLERELLSGADSAITLHGILNYGTVLNMPSLENTIDAPTKIQIIDNAITQVYSQGKVRPNVILVNAGDFQEMKNTMDLNLNTVQYAYVKITDNTLTISGVPVEVHDLLTKDTFVCGNLAYFNFIYKKQITEDMTNYNGTDWENNRISIKRDARGLSYMADCDQDKLVVDTYTNAAVFLQSL